MYYYFNHLLSILLVLGYSANALVQDISDKVTEPQTLEQTSNIKNKVQTLTDIAWDHILKENDSALIYANKALEFSKQNNYPTGQAIALETKGLYHEIATGNLERASTFYFEAIAICEQNNLDYIASIYHSLGVLFHTSDNYQNALEYYTKAYDGALKNNDLVLQKKCLINLGSVNSSLENYDDAKLYLQKSLEISTRPDFDYSTFVNLGNLYIRLEQYKESLPYLTKAIEVHPDNPDAEEHIYFLMLAKNKLNDTTGMKTLVRRALDAVDATSVLRIKSLLLTNVADYYTVVGDYKTALKYRDAYIHTYEEIKEKQRDETVYELETQYQTEKKDTQLRLLALKNEKTRNERLLFIGISITGVLIAGLIGFSLYKNRKKNKLLAKQKVMLEKTLDEKNILLKETHHRVKNSFQMVSSLLQYQSHTIKDKEAKIAIKEAQNRVRSMVLIHQKLYSKDQLVGIDSKEYITDFTEDVIRSNEVSGIKLNYQLDLASHILDIETITPIGLILNELLTNVLKHAFDVVTGQSAVHITFKHELDTLILVVADNGVGIQGKRKDTSFGLKLIETLAKKLKGNLVITKNNPNGTIATLTMQRFTIL